jgi:hypothetical protein
MSRKYIVFQFQLWNADVVVRNMKDEAWKKHH